MLKALAILSIVSGVLASLCMVVLMLAGMPNSTPEKLREIKLWMLAVAVVAGVGLIGGVGAMIASKPWLGAILGAVPVAFVIGLFVFLLVAER